MNDNNNNGNIIAVLNTLVAAMGDLKGLLEAPKAATDQSDTLKALAERLDKVEAARWMEDTVKAAVAEALKNNDALRDNVRDWARDVAHEVFDAKVEDYAFERRITSIIEDHDFTDSIQRVVEDAVETAVDDAFSNHDWAESVNEALNEIDMEDHVRDAVERLDLSKQVREAVNEALKEVKLSVSWGE